jgi:transcriptional regulator with PAS, ATPase and Fis domain
MSTMTETRSERATGSRAHSIPNIPQIHSAIVAESVAMQEVLEAAVRAAHSDATVLITGESGTGKELVAEVIHQQSPRADGPLVPINMAAMPETLVESELFGHASGSFTGATSARKGCFETANGGTLFIDEIGDLHPASQAKVLRVLETHCVTPVGSNDSRAVNVRVVAATHRNLAGMIAGGEFREDLYYRLNVVQIAIPALRTRPEDIGPLIDRFLDEAAASVGRPVPAINQELRDYMLAYDWPGNVRQLRNCIESLVVLSAGETLTMNALPATVRPRPSDADASVHFPADFTLADVERAVISQTLSRFGGDRTRAAKALGVSVRTIQRRLRRWRVRKDGQSDGA